MRALNTLGLGVPPQYRLHSSATTQTTPAPTLLAISPTVETATSAMVSITPTEIVGPDEVPSVDSGSINDNDPNGLFTADGSTWEITVTTLQAVPTIGNLTAGTSPNINLGTDSASSNPISFTVNWTAATIGVGYEVNLYQNSSLVLQVFVSGIGSTSTVLDVSSVQQAAAGAFAGYAYPQIPTATPATGPSGIGGSIIDVGSGSLGPASGVTYNFEVDSYITAQSLRWTSNSPSTFSINDDNDGQFFNISVNWTDGGGTEGFILRVSTDGGSSWTYQDLGYTTGITFTGFSNDPAAEARWGQAYGGVIPTTHNYAAHSYLTSPAQYFNATPASNSLVVSDNPATGYVVQLDLVYGATPNVRVLGSPNADGGTSNSFDTAATTYIDTPSSWPGGATVTPNHVGFLSAGQTITFRAFAQRTSPSTYYSATYDEEAYTFPNDAAYRYLSVSWTLGVGSTNTKFLRNTGAGFNTGHLQGGSSFTYVDAGGGSTSPTFSSGTVVTPNTIAGIAGFFQSPAATTADLAQITIKATTSGGVSKIAFVNNADTQQAFIAFDAPGNQFRFESGGGNFGIYGNGVRVIQLQSARAYFNEANNANYEFLVRSQDGNHLIYASALYRAVSIGSQTNIGAACLSLYNPRTDTPTLYIRSTSGSVQNALTVVDSGMTQTYGVSYDGHHTFANAKNLIFGTGTGTKIGTAATQKLGFWNAAPIVQPVALGTIAGFVAGAGLPVLVGSTSTGGVGAGAYTFGDIVRVLKAAGLIAV